MLPTLTEFFSPTLTESLLDKFPKTFPEFKKMVDDECKRKLGHNYKDVIDKSQPMGQGATDEAIKQFWDGHWTAHETEGEIGFLYDIAQQNTGLTNPSIHYPHMNIKKNGKLEREDPKGTRTSRPMDKSWFHNYWDDDDDYKSVTADDFTDLE